MSKLSEIWRRVQMLVRREKFARDLEEEMRLHRELKEKELIADGVEEREARYSANREFGNATYLRDCGRDAWGWSWLENFANDVCFGARMLWQNPGFTIVAVLTLALGIGANTAIFSYVNAWMIRPLPYPQAERLMVFESHDKQKGSTREGVTSTASFLDFQKQNTSFEQTALWAGWNFNLTGGGAAALVEGGRVSWNYFDALGVKPMLGRTFTPDEDQPGAGHVAILSQGLWQSRFAGDGKIIGRTITVEGEPYTVVGVMPGTFQFMLMGVANLWTPLALTDEERGDRARSRFSAFGRLKPGVTPEQAGAENAAVFCRLEKQFPETNTQPTFVSRSLTAEILR